MTDIIQLWQTVLVGIGDKLNEGSFDFFIQPLEPVLWNDSTLVLQAPNDFVRRSLESRYDGMLLEAVRTACGKPVDLRIILPTERTNMQPATSPVMEQKILEPQSMESTLNPKFTFDTFVVGKSNRFAHACAQAVAESPGKVYNPLFIYSGVGLGKTHLMHAIGNYIVQNNPGSHVKYVTSETFTNELITMLQTRKNAEDFRNLYRNVDCLLIDDIQFLIGKDSSQEEFFHTFNALRDGNKQIIISSDKQPREMPAFEERLRSRFEWGLTADIQLPDYETRVAILLNKTKGEGSDIADDVIYFIAEKIDSNIRVLEGALNRVMTYARFSDQAVTIAVAQEALKDYISPSKNRTITPQLITQTVAECYNVKLDDLYGKRRTRDISLPRQICMYLIREMLGVSLPKIGEQFGGRDHSTVMHACREIASQRSGDVAFDANIEDIVQKIKN